MNSNGEPMLLTSILGAPFVVGLLCLLGWPRQVLELLNLVGFLAALVAGVKLLPEVLANGGGAVTEWGEFLRADALSGWMVLLISIVSLATSLYAVRYFRRDLAGAIVTERRFREYYILTPFFATGMFLVVLANNLGVMWMGVEGAAPCSGLVVALFNRRTPLARAWENVMLGGLGVARWCLLSAHPYPRR